MKRMMAYLLLIGAMLAFCVSKADAWFVLEPQSNNLVFAYCINSSGQIVSYCDVTLGNYGYFFALQHNHDVPAPPIS